MEKSVRFNKTKTSPTGDKTFKKTPHSNKATRLSNDAIVRKSRKLDFSKANGSDKVSSPPKSANGVAKTNTSKIKNTVFVGNLPSVVKASDLKSCFSVFGVVVNARIRGHSLKKEAKTRRAGAILMEVDRDNVSAYVRFSTEEEMRAAVKANGVFFENRHLRIDFADPKEQRGVSSNKAIFIRNIDYEVTEDDLWKTFSQCGQVESVRIMRNPGLNYQPRGMGYVNFTSPESVSLALDLSKTGIVFNGRELKVYRYTLQNKKNKNATADSKKLGKNKKKDKKTKKNGEDFAGNQAQAKKRKHKAPDAQDVKKRKLAEILTK